MIYIILSCFSSFFLARIEHSQLLRLTPPLPVRILSTTQAFYCDTVPLRECPTPNVAIVVFNKSYLPSNITFLFVILYDVYLFTNLPSGCIISLLL